MSRSASQSVRLVVGRTQKISAAWGAILGMHIGGPVTRHSWSAWGTKYQECQIDDQTTSEDDTMKVITGIIRTAVNHRIINCVSL